MMNEQPQPGTDNGKASSSRRPYATPRLTACGDVRGLTLGGSPGQNDSGPVQPTQPPT